MSERHACRLLGQWRGTQRYKPLQRIEDEALTRAIVALASEYGVQHQETALGARLL